MEPIKYTPTDLVAVINQTLDYAYPNVYVEGEVSGFKINQGKWVFFDLKDDNTVVNCFMTKFQLRTPIEDGMKIIIRGVPKLTKYGKFSITVQAIQPVGAGTIKKTFELLKKKLTLEGLFDQSKKRQIPANLSKIGVISSIQAAGYADFIKIINERWGGLKITTAHTQVQGMDAADQIIRAIDYFNEQGKVEIIAIIRGGGSADDLAVFNDEKLVRKIASSKIPVITGIGHEIDESLADLAADIRASTPSNVAQMLTPDRKAEKIKIENTINRAKQVIFQNIESKKRENESKVSQILREIQNKAQYVSKYLEQKIKILEALNPDKILKQGYAIVTGKISPGNIINITTHDKKINAEIKEVYDRDN